MAVKIRLTRMGRKKICRYRLVAVDHRAKRDGRFLEILGNYNPQSQPRQFLIKTERVAYWIKQGAQPSDTVRSLLEQDRFWEKMEALGKGVAPDQMNLERLPEPKHTKKKKSKEKAAA